MFTGTSSIDVGSVKDASAFLVVRDKNGNFKGIILASVAYRQFQNGMLGKKKEGEKDWLEELLLKGIGLPTILIWWADGSTSMRYPGVGGPIRDIEKLGYTVGTEAIPLPKNLIGKLDLTPEDLLGLEDLAYRHA